MRANAETAQHSVEAEVLARELLLRILTPEQKESFLEGQSIIETGKYGRYEIPLEPGRIRFDPSPIRRGLVWKFLNLYLLLFHDSAAGLCQVKTVKNGPWCDAMATFILYIRAGKEFSLFWRGGW